MSQRCAFLTEACVIHGILTMLCSIKAWSFLHSCTYWLICCRKPVGKSPIFYSRLHKATMPSPNFHNTKQENRDFIRAAHRDVHLLAALLDVGRLRGTSTRPHYPLLNGSSAAGLVWFLHLWAESATVLLRWGISSCTITAAALLQSSHTLWDHSFPPSSHQSHPLSSSPVHLFML